MKVEAAMRIDAPPERIYSLIADYRSGHTRILPPKYFKGLQVEEGGVGDGTVIRFAIRILGRTLIGRAMVTEPQPGRELVETDVVTGIPTTFRLAPEAGRTGTRVTISTDLGSAKGLKRLEAFIAKPFLRRIYVEELSLLKAVAERGDDHGVVTGRKADNLESKCNSSVL
jgi:hypothetical protein